jgi:hypothetical protein
MTGCVVRQAVAVVLVLVSLGSAPVLANDEPDELLAGRTGVIETLSKVKVVAEGASFTLPGAANDPTVEGATIRVFDTGVGGDDNTYTLPAAGWMPEANGFRYVGAGTITDPCDRVDLLTDRILVRCPGAVTLTPPIAGTVGIIFTVGTPSKRYCFEFGGTVVDNEPGKWKAKEASAPGACPTPPAATPDVPVPGKSVLILTGLRAKFLLKAPLGEVFDLPNFPDANPLAQGATIDIFDTGVTGGSNTYSLPAGPKWSLVGTGFKYKGTGDPGDPCKVVRLKKNQVKATCSGTDVTLSPPFTGDVGIRVTIGANAHRYCARFDASNEIANEAGFLKRKDVPAPGACP